MIRFSPLCLLFLLLSVVLFISCATPKKIKSSDLTLAHLLNNSPVFNNHFTGFSLYDPIAKKYILHHNDSKFFTPASNTKILTLYAALKSLPSVLPSYKYLETESDLIIKGMGDPTLLHSLWPEHPGWQKLLTTNKKIHLISDQWQDAPQGAGWAWDDYQEDYQADVNDLPLYGNLIEFKYDSLTQSIKSNPNYFASKWYWNLKKTDRVISRNVERNEFMLDTSFRSNYYIPFKADYRNTVGLLQDTLKKGVSNKITSEISTNNWNIQYGVSADSVYAQMMKVSDNFIAEQLILMSGAYTIDTCHTSYFLKKLKSQLFDTLPPFQWFDGSGLSRYNLITPLHLIHVLDKIQSIKGYSWIQKIFPAGGLSGTIKNSYKSDSPYIFAKTGSLMNNHSLSGYLKTRKNQWLIFSFMHSNYTGSAAPIRNEMQKTLEFIRDNY